METKVLLIEDEEDLCTILKRFLERKQYRVECSHTISEGLEKTSTFQPDIVFLDHSLPDGKGVDAIGIIKHILPQVRVVMMSAMDQFIETALARGAEKFIKKPFHARQIVETLAGQDAHPSGVGKL